jgi:hypothetical protein
MAFVLRPIEQLQLSNSKIWILDWFGGLVDNPEVPSNPSIECILTPCLSSPDRASGLKRHIGSQICTTVGSCAINAIALGRQYVDGEFVPVNLESGTPEETITFQFEPKLRGSIEETFLHQVGISDYSALINNNLIEIGIESPVKLVNGFLTSTNNPRSPDRSASELHPAPLRVMFHELEIIRFYYTNSERLVRSVFDGEFESDKLTRHVINTNHEGPHYDLKKNKCRFEYRYGFDRGDAQIIARSLFDPTLTTIKGVRRVYQSMLASKLNEQNIRKTAYPRTLFPYSDKVELMLTGRRLRMIDGSFVLAVHRIESCDAPFPYVDLSVQCEMEPGGDNEAPPGSPAAFCGRPPNVNGPGQSGGELDSESPPKAGSGFAECVPETRRFLGLSNTRLLVEKYRPNTHTSSERTWEKFDPELTKSSPGKATHGQSEATNQKITDTLEDGDPPVDLDTFIEILSGLKVKYTRWQISTVPAGPGGWKDKNTKVVYSGFPTVACPEMTTVWRHFSFLDKYKKKRRRIVCIRIFAQKKYVYLLEAERRRNDRGAYMEELPILMLWTPGLKPISRSKFELMLTMTVKNPSKTWPKDTSSLGLMRQGIDHGKARNVADLVTRLGKFVTTVIDQGGL